MQTVVMPQLLNYELWNAHRKMSSEKGRKFQQNHTNQH